MIQLKCLINVNVFMHCSVYYIRKFYLSSQYQPHRALMLCWPVIFSFVCAAFITAISEVCAPFAHI